MVEWRIYYEDESVFDSTMGEPHEAPPYGVIIIVLNDPAVGRILLHGWDWYVFKKGELTDSDELPEWSGHDIFGLTDQFQHYAPQITACLQGRCTNNTRWHNTLQRAHNDPDFPPKQGWLRTERKF